jgi:transposase-like protein
VCLEGRLRGRPQGSEDRWEAMRALSSRPFCPCASRQVSLEDLSAAYRDTTKRRVNPGLGFGSFRTARRTIQGYEAMHMIRKGQAEGGAKGDVLAQNCVMAQVCGLIA